MNSSVSSLITLERMQKLDLLTHLISNLRQSLVLCGPTGIGKSTLLEVLQAKKPESWLLCPIVATDQSSFEQIQTELLHMFSEININNHDVNECLQQLQKLNKKIVLIIDNAGQLVPGLITALCQFSMVSTHLRIIFALTPDELHVKKTSDKIIEDCHFIDLPALSEKQCGGFLQNLSSKPGATLSFDAISTAMIAKVYRETHGIPGKIVDLQCGVISIKNSKPMIWVYVLVLCIIIAAGSSVLLLSSEQEGVIRNDSSALNTDKKIQVEIVPPVFNQVAEISELEIDLPEQQNQEQVTAPESIQQPESIDSPPLLSSAQHQKIIQPVVITEIEDMAEVEVSKVATKQAEPQVLAETLEKDATKAATIQYEKGGNKIVEVKKLIDAKLANEATLNKNSGNVAKQNNDISQKLEAIEQKPAPTDKGEEKKKKSVDLMRNGKQWVLDQPQQNYTLQLMSLETQQALEKVISKHSNLHKNFHVYKSHKKGKSRFVLLYGSFPNLKQAGKASNTLPAVFKPSWTRRFKIIQKEVRANLP